MPYAITTNTGCADAECNPNCRNRKRVQRTVETLDEAQAYLSGFLEARLEWPANPDASRLIADQLWNLPESGGTIGPLPDGTVIEVVRA